MNVLTYDDYVAHLAIENWRSSLPIHALNDIREYTNRPEDLAVITPYLEGEDINVMTFDSIGMESVHGSLGPALAGIAIQHPFGILLVLDPKLIMKDRASVEEMVKHELIHAKQYKDGRLNTINNKIHWLNVEWDIAPYFRTIYGRLSISLQLCLPWEREAYMANVTLPGIKVCYALSSCLGNISEADMLLELELYLGLKLLNNELTEDQIVDLVKGKTLYEVYDLVTT